MKKLQIQISDESHAELLKIQLERKVKKEPRTTLIEIASDVLEEALLKGKADPKEPSK
ncbi:hypothetical protein [Pontibacter litorisediminis]|uniref:hypothetical protein n=1 Tax=Pontibacter litorisediminis TaxID=1846260 RepID=UPI0023EC1904|nr:hypothetical protein [Pontibacter litorisediminis]